MVDYFNNGYNSYYKMLTGTELLKDLESIKKKAELVEITYPGNEIWSEVNSKLRDLIDFIKSDKRIYKW